MTKTFACQNHQAENKVQQVQQWDMEQLYAFIINIAFMHLQDCMKYLNIFYLQINIYKSDNFTSIQTNAINLKKNQCHCHYIVNISLPVLFLTSSPKFKLKGYVNNAPHALFIPMLLTKLKIYTTKGHWGTYCTDMLMMIWYLDGIYRASKYMHPFSMVISGCPMSLNFKPQTYLTSININI